MLYIFSMALLTIVILDKNVNMYKWEVHNAFAFLGLITHAHRNK